MSATFEIGGASTRVGGEIDYAEQNVLNSEKVGAAIIMSRWRNRPPPPLADNRAVHLFGTSETNTYLIDVLLYSDCVYESPIDLLLLCNVMHCHTLPYYMYRTFRP